MAESMRGLKDPIDVQRYPVRISEVPLPLWVGYREEEIWEA